MGALRGDIEAALLRGLGAYLRATPANELPPSVRALKAFQQKALGRHKAKVLDLLDDAATRARVREWLDDGKVPIKKEDVPVLRTAVSDDEGERAALLGVEEKEEEPDLAALVTRLERALQREKSKVKKARDDLKREREAADAAMKEERERTSEAQEAMGELQALFEEQRELASSSRRAAEAERAASERQLRKARKEADQARSRLEDMRLEQKELRKKLREAERTVASSRASAGSRKSTPRGAASGAPRGPRKPLRVPKGLLQDAPETLDAWLGAPSVQLIVDGYNVSKLKAAFGDLDLATQRERLVDAVGGLARKKKVEVVLVFDGSEVLPGNRRRRRGSVKVEYSRPDEIADDHIIALIERLPPFPVVLVTNDRELQERGSALGATVATSEQLLALIR